MRTFIISLLLITIFFLLPCTALGITIHLDYQTAFDDLFTGDEAWSDVSKSTVKSYISSKTNQAVNKMLQIR